MLRAIATCPACGMRVSLDTSWRCGSHVRVVHGSPFYDEPERRHEMRVCPGVGAEPLGIPVPSCGAIAYLAPPDDADRGPIQPYEPPIPRVGRGPGSRIAFAMLGATE
jgi:hypothetical protein